MRELKVTHQNYAWGALGSSSVRDLARANAARHGDGLSATDDADSVPFAELWAGTHPSGMSHIAPDDDAQSQTLLSYVQSNAERALGAECVEKFGKDVPFLMKVLSVRGALSIQAHPDKALAARLHAQNPGAYKDSNHKPEMAVAIGDFEALSGFVHAKTLAERLQRTPELASVVGDERCQAFIDCVSDDAKSDTERIRQAFKDVFRAIMTANDDVVRDATRALATRLKSAEPTSLDDAEAVYVRLIEQYPDDVGALCAFILNHINLRPGEGIYMAANEPHAYLFGECVEVMATSDNVVRAGLTPKFRDVDVLCDMLTYELGAPTILAGDVIDACTKRYVPPFDEFALDVVSCAPGAALGVPARVGPSIWLISRGSATFNGTPVRPGAVVFVENQEPVNIIVDDDDDGDGFHAYACAPNV